jgi:hypothetical protein
MGGTRLELDNGAVTGIGTRYYNSPGVGQVGGEVKATHARGFDAESRCNEGYEQHSVIIDENPLLSRKVFSGV